MDSKIKLEPELNNKVNINKIRLFQQIINFLLYIILRIKLNITFTIIKLLKYTFNLNKVYFIVIY